MVEVGSVCIATIDASCSKSKARIVNSVCGKEKKCYFKVHAMKLKDEETLQIRSYFPSTLVVTNVGLLGFDDDFNSKINKHILEIVL